METIRLVHTERSDLSQYKVQLADCVVLTHDNKILMQKRPETWDSFPGVVNIFGGHIDGDETPLEAVKRELNEELGAIIDDTLPVFIGAVTEECTDHSELIHVFLWKDSHQTITGCYEAESIIFNDVQHALLHPKIMDYTVWALLECQKNGLL